MMSDPVTMALGAAAGGALIDKKQPLRGAALGGLGGYFLAPMMTAGAGAAGGAGMAGKGAMGAIAGMNPVQQATAMEYLTGAGASANPVALSSMAQIPQSSAAHLTMTGGAPLMASGVPSAAAKMGAMDWARMGARVAGQGQQQGQGQMSAPPQRMAQGQGQGQSFAGMSPYASAGSPVQPIRSQQRLNPFLQDPFFSPYG